MKRNPDAWKPNVMNSGNNVDLASVEARIAKVRKEVRGLLNKITLTTYADLTVEMINKCVWKDEDTLPTVVELIFIKAVEEPTFVGLYSDLCYALHKSEQTMKGASHRPRFFCAIIRKCQREMESI
uniref:MIF4G domain-containing protein n=1 Tax=Panagrolaimus sp. PS1159 TaxID=55785 RepID=A0AC35FSP7_9BILA